MFEHLDVRPAIAGRTGCAGTHRVLVFGGLSVEPRGVSSGPLAGQRKCLALLAILAVGGRRGMARDKLMALLGPDADTEHARNALSQVVFRVRRALGQTVIEGKDELALNANLVTSDVGDFDGALASGCLEDAAACYRGPFLDGFYLREAREFEQWAGEVRARLEQQYLSALDKLASASCHRGNVDAAVAWCRRRMEADPLSTLAARQLVLALVASGDRDQALRFGLEYSERSRMELDTAPDGDFKDLLRAIRVGLPLPQVRSSAVASGRATEPGPFTSDAQSAGRPLEMAVEDSRRPRRRPVRRVKPFAVAAAFAATMVCSALLSGWRSARAPVLVVPAFINATGDTSLDVASRLAATWTTDAVVAAGVLRVADVAGVVRAPDVRDSSGMNPDRLLDAARRSGATLVALGELSRLRAESVDVSVRIVRASSGATILESAPARAPARSAQQLSGIAREQAIGLLTKLLERRGGAPPTN